ncbi:MAG: cysteine--tRNA ligase [Synergistaceae bacterium]|nr:cysteine--tRNA ligase [Synergistaceae bacterium]
MSLYIYNDLTRKKEEFIPVEKGRVKFYVCGPTVYDYFHIGNARPFVVFDTFRRYLEYLGYEVTFVQNFTDIDDKMIKRANERGITVAELAEEFIKAYFEDVEALGVHIATVHPRATKEIDTIIEIISKLINTGHAYVSNGDVYFAVDSFKEYGKLSKQSIDDLQSGARVEPGEQKKNPLDFALWKSAKPGEPKWQSPWGEGRPGWHIECSAMSTKYLGKTIDIHGGGSDLIFPHHENEIAQSECANNAQFVKYWLHNAYLLINSEKMSKSLGNFLTVREIRKKINPLVLRFFLLSAHYRSPLNFTEEALMQAKSALERIHIAYNELFFALDNKEDGEKSVELSNAVDEAKKKFEEAMNDDFNTASAFAVIFDLVKTLNIYLKNNLTVDKNALKYAKKFFDITNKILGYLPSNENNEDTSEIESLLCERNEARKNKDFKRSDEIRNILLKQGIVIEDTKDGTRWRRQ